jgi:hypothetical protein
MPRTDTVLAKYSQPCGSCCLASRGFINHVDLLQLLGLAVFRFLPLKR